MCNIINRRQYAKLETVFSIYLHNWPNLRHSKLVGKLLLLSQNKP